MKRHIMMALVVTVMGSACAHAADEQLVRQFIAKIDFRAEIESNIRAARSLSSDRLQQFLALINFKKIEDSYVSSMASAMSNEEVKALIQAYDIPGFKSALRKQVQASGSVIATTINELERAAKELNKR